MKLTVYLQIERVTCAMLGVSLKGEIGNRIQKISDMLGIRTGLSQKETGDISHITFQAYTIIIKWSKGFCSG